MVRKTCACRNPDARAFENAVRTLAAIGGSTNAVLHLLAFAGTLGVPLVLADFDRLSAEMPLLVDLQPSGRFLMEDLHYAGGLPAVMKELGSLLHTMRRRSPARRLARAVPGPNASTARSSARSRPVKPSLRHLGAEAATCVRNGAVMKPSAAQRAVHASRPRGRVRVDRGFHARIDDPALEVDETACWCSRAADPRAIRACPKSATCRCRASCSRSGIKDMVRISDARMSGTAFGTVVLHVAPEAAAGGPLAIVRSGDEILLDGPNRRLELLVSEREIATRLEVWRKNQGPPKYTRGYYRLYTEHVTQADRGCDFDFLAGASGSTVERESH
jgi:dihydroxyacid dehydratase/phosphogluconate dehydratase